MIWRLTLHHPVGARPSACTPLGRASGETLAAGGTPLLRMTVHGNMKQPQEGSAADALVLSIRPAKISFGGTLPIWQMLT